MGWVCRVKYKLVRNDYMETRSLPICRGLSTCSNCREAQKKLTRDRRISNDTTAIVEWMFLEKIPLAGIARSLQISES